MANSEVEEAVIRKTVALHHSELKSIYSGLECLTQGLNECAPIVETEQKPADKELKSVLLGLAWRSVDSLRMAVVALEMGYYQQGLASVRISEEDCLTAMDATTYPPTLAALLKGEGKIGRGDLRYDKMAERMSVDYEKAWQEIYGFLSKHGAHPRYESLKGLARIGPQGESIFRAGYEERDANELLKFIARGCINTVNAVVYVMIAPTSEPLNSAVERAMGGAWGKRTLSVTATLRTLLCHLP